MARDYDNTNRGAMFRPYNDQKLILQGELDIEGDSHRLAIIKQPVKRDGPPELVVYQKIGVLFANRDRQSENSPNYSGPLDLPGPKRRLAAWKQTSERAGSYLSLAVSEQEQRRDDRARDDQRSFEDDLDDEIPF